MISIEKPGEFPYTRGLYPDMYNSRLWTIRQYAGFGSVEETNKYYHYLLEQGQTGLSIAFDLCTQLGYDSDHPYCRGEVGKVGVSVNTLEDMVKLFFNIPLDQTSVSMTINAPAVVLFAMYLCVAQKQGVPFHLLRGTIQNDILKEYIARGAYIFPPEPSLKMTIDLIEYANDYCPKFNPISISGYHMREAGSTAAQEVGFTLINGITYIQNALNRGLDVNQFAQRFSFFFSVHNNIFEEIAKFRAARRLWAKVMKNQFHVKDSKAMMLRFHTQTAGCTLTAQQPENNIIRVTLQALAAVLGGTQSLHTNSFDEALALPSEHAATIALRIQQILASESGITTCPDPVGGSFWLESLTDEIEKKADDYIQKITNSGGVVPTIKSGWIQQEIQDASYAYEMDIQDKKKIVVGLNKYEQTDVKELKLHQHDSTLQAQRINILEKFKKKRNQTEISSRLQMLENKLKQNENIMPYLIEVVQKGCTVGEICDVMRKVYGEYEETTFF